MITANYDYWIAYTRREKLFRIVIEKLQYRMDSWRDSRCCSACAFPMQGDDRYMCGFCWWEDDMPDWLPNEPSPSNHDLTLNQARDNFDSYLGRYGIYTPKWSQAEAVLRHYAKFRPLMLAYLNLFTATSMDDLLTKAGNLEIANRHFTFSAPIRDPRLDTTRGKPSCKLP